MSLAVSTQIGPCVRLRTHNLALSEAQECQKWDFEFIDFESFWMILDQPRLNLGWFVDTRDQNDSNLHEYHTHKVKSGFETQECQKSSFNFLNSRAHFGLCSSYFDVFSSFFDTFWETFRTLRMVFESLWKIFGTFWELFGSFEQKFGLGINYFLWSKKAASKKKTKKKSGINFSIFIEINRLLRV